MGAIVKPFGGNQKNGKAINFKNLIQFISWCQSFFEKQQDQNPQQDPML